eukprot:m.38083 g.38083  ORF g.38083 m.38083 type:complete len:2096 (+) comp5614_c0_seq1:192-6479(+)
MWRRPMHLGNAVHVIGGMALAIIAGGLQPAQGQWAAPISAEGVSIVWYSSARQTVVVGDRQTLRLFNAENGTLRASVVMGDPGNCTRFDSTAAQPHAAVLDTTFFNCSLAASAATCVGACRWIAQQSTCVPEPFYSTCGGNTYYFATSVGNGSAFVVCSALGQCEQRDAGTLSLLSTGPTVAGLSAGFPTPSSGPGPRGWYCGTPSFAATFNNPNDAATVSDEYCPVWRYGPPVPDAWLRDSAAGVIATDDGLGGDPEVLFMLTSREQRRDNGLLARPQFAGPNRVDEPTKRSLATFGFTGCPNPTSGRCTPVSSPQSYLAQSSVQTVSTPLNVSTMYGARHLNTYVAGWTLGDYVYFTFQECVDTSNGVCGSTVSKIARFCRRTLGSATSQSSSVSVNGFRKISVGCGGRRTVVAARAIQQPPSSLTSTLGPGAVLLMVSCDTNSAGIRSNFAICIHKLNGSAVGGSGSTVDAVFDAQYGQVTCSSTFAPLAETGGVLIGTAAHNRLVYANASESWSSLDVDVANGYVALYLGSITGSVVRLVLNGPSTMPTSWSNPNGGTLLRISHDMVQTGSTTGTPMVTSLVTDTGRNGVIVGQVNSVDRVDFANCSMYTSCATCVAAASIYCGWCPLSARCTARQECADPNGFERDDSAFSLYWAGPGSNATASCPRSTTTFPAVSTGVPATLTIATSGLPVPQPSQQYFCRIEWGAGPEVAPATFAAGTVQCGAITLPALSATTRPHSSTHNVSVLYGRDVATASGVLQAGMITVYDCSVHTLCTDCMATQFTCGWCPLGGTCVDTTLNCDEQVNTTSACPAVTAITPQHVHSGTLNVPIAVSGVHLPQPTGGTVYSCRFVVLGGATTYTGAGVFSSPSRVVCSLPSGLPGLTSPTAGVTDYAVELVVGTAVIARQTPATNITLEVYDCPLLGLSRGSPDCGQCLSSAGAPRNCGWCFATLSCTLNTTCSGSGGWNSGDLLQCSPPSITSISPSSGPLNGGTLVTILGNNFGRTVSDIGAVSIAGVPGSVVSYSGTSGELVVSTRPASSPTDGRINVSAVGDRIATSGSNFRYVIPLITQVSVQRGPASGGTAVIVAGQHLQSGNNLSIRLDGRQCIVSSVTISGDTATVFCITSSDPSDSLRGTPYNGRVCVQVDSMIADGQCAERITGGYYAFELLPDPTLSSITPTFAPISGGINISLSGTNLHAAASPRVSALRGTALSSAVLFSVRDISYSLDGSSAQFLAPPFPVTSSVVPTNFSEGVWLEFAFDAATIVHFPLTYISDPSVSAVSPLSGDDGIIVRITGSRFQQAGQPLVYFGTERASPVEGLSDDTDIVVTLPARPLGAPSKVNITIVHGLWNYTYPEQFNYTVAAAPSSSSDGVGVVIAGPVVGVLLLMVIIATVLYWHQRKKRALAEKQMVDKINLLEKEVVDVCKQGFAELQGDSTLSMEQIQSWAKPRSLEAYMLRVCYTHRDTHPVPMAKIPQGYSDVVDLFSAVLRNEKFVRVFTRIIELTAGRSVADKCHVAALLQTSIGRDSEYGYRIMVVLMSQFLASREARKNPKLVLRRTESIAEKYVSCWMSREMYQPLVDSVGKSLYTLVQALRIQAEKGPVDAVSGSAMYTLNGNYLLRDKISFERLHISISAVSGTQDITVDLTVNSTDTPSQCVEKIVEAVAHGGDDAAGPFLHPFVENHDRKPADVYTLVEETWPSGRKLVDIDELTKYDPVSGMAQLNTLQQYRVLSGAKLRLVKTDAIKAAEATKTTGKDRRYSQGKSSKVAAMREAAHWHLGRDEKSASDKVLPGEVFLTYMLTMKGIVQPFVDKLLGHIFSPPEVPTPVKRLFDFLDVQAVALGIKDPAVRHIWKSNAVPLRFWVNIVKNPDFLYDVRKSDSMNANLSTVAQVILDSCARTAQPLGKNSSVNKLLYRGEVDRWRDKVAEYYERVSDAPHRSAVPRRGPTKTSTTPIEANAMLLLLGYAAECRTQISDRLDEQGLGSLAKDFLTCCTAYENASKHIIARARSDSASPNGEDSLPDGYLEIATRSSVVLDASLFEDANRWSRASATESLHGFGDDFDEEDEVASAPAAAKQRPSIYLDRAEI